MSKRTIVILIVALIMALSCILPACATQKETLSAPILSEAHLLTWAPIDGAEYYVVRVMLNEYDGYEVPVTEPKYTLKLFEKGTYAISISAQLSTGRTAFSEALIYTLSEDTPYTPVDPDPSTPDAPHVFVGDGTLANPLQICDIEDLKHVGSGMRSITNADGSTTEVQNFYVLMADIDLAGVEWTSIGSSTRPFQGKLDGNGHTIRNITQTQPNGKNDYRNGLFSTLDYATIINLNIENYSATIGTTRRGIDIGPLAGYSNRSTIENCRVNGHIFINSPVQNTDRAYVGMLVGSSYSTEVRYCETSGDIDVTYPRAYAGGIAGITNNTSGDIIDSCLTDVDIVLYGTGYSQTTSTAGSAVRTADARVNAGGLVGWVARTESIHGNVALGTLQVGMDDGNEITNAGVGFFGGGYVNTTKDSVKYGLSFLTYTDCYYNLDGILLPDNTTPQLSDTLPTWGDVARRYAIGGVTKTQQNATSVYAVTNASKGMADSYLTLDFENTWQIKDGKLTLRQRHAGWHTVRWMAGDEEKAVTYVLDGHRPTAPGVVAPKGYSIQKWTIDGEVASNQPITQDCVVVATLTPDA